MSYEINEIFAEMEFELIESYKRSVAKGTDRGFDSWQKQKLIDLKEYRQETRKIVNKYTAKAGRVSAKRIAESYGSKMDETFVLGLRQRPIDSDTFFKVNRRKVDALIDAVNNDYKKAGVAALRLTDDKYREIIFKSQMFLSSGTMTLNQAIDRAAHDFLHKGINCIEYANGNKVNIASYAEMALRTANKRAVLTGQGAMMAEQGEYLVQVSSYGACSDTCLPWQGKVYFDDVYAGGTPGKDNKYPLLSTAMAEGLYHPNCRHSQDPYIEGISNEPPKGFDEGKVRERYAAEQKQRAIERKIREWKRVEAGSVDKDNKDFAAGKVKAWQKSMRDHIQKHPFLTRKYPREKVRAYPEQVVKPTVDPTKYSNYAEMWMDMDSEQQAILTKYLADNDMKLKDYYNNATAGGTKTDIPEWKEYPGKASDFALKDGLDIAEEKFDILISRHMGTTTGNANKGVISLNDAHLSGMSKEQVKRIVDHEIGHRLTEISPELQLKVIENYDGALGRYNQKKGYFEGLFGESSPEESWAEAFSVYLNDAKQLKDRYPKAFEAIDSVVKSDPNVRVVIKNYHDKMNDILNPVPDIPVKDWDKLGHTTPQATESLNAELKKFGVPKDEWYLLREHTDSRWGSAYKYVGDSAPVNRPLRGQKVPKASRDSIADNFDFDTIVKHLDELIKDYEIKEPIVVSRTVSSKVAQQFKIGEKFSDKAYISTSMQSLDKITNYSFGAIRGAELPQGIEILVPAGKGWAIPLGQVTPGGDWANELLLKRDSIFEIVGRKADGTWLMKLIK